jgi:molecular chaperone DnaK
LILKELKRRTDSLLLQEQLSISAVITVPAHFNGRQKDETVQAARVAGFTEVQLLSEASAAFAFGYSTQNKAPNRKMLVFDFGAGTCDASLLSVEMEQRFRSLRLTPSLN